MTTDKNWMVIDGQPIDTICGGGFEFFGPFTEAEARIVRQSILVARQQAGSGEPHGSITMAVELLRYPPLERGRLRALASQRNALGRNG